MSSPTIVIFGATGDLAKNKILPSLFKLWKNEQLKSKILCVGRKDWGNLEYSKFLKLEKNSGIKKKEMESFIKNIHYLKMDFKSESYEKFSGELKRLCSKERIFYLSLPYFVFSEAAKVIKDAGLLKSGKNKVVFEKPFGRDTKSAKKLNKMMVRMFGEDNIYRVDHYLGKNVVDNILVLRFANSLFEDVWCRDFIDHVQITLSEDFGIGDRGNYYDKTGAIRDMVQNHVIQLLSLVAMEPPKTLYFEDIRNEKVRVITSLKKVKKEDIVLGQYSSKGKIKSYRNEKNVKKNSNTETYVAFKTYVGNKRWKGVPFYIRSGKRMSAKYSEINVVFKKSANLLFKKENEKPNIISIRINPQASVDFRFNTKTPLGDELKTTVMEFCYECEFGPNTPEAYEEIFSEIIKGNKAIFIRGDEVIKSWKFADDMIKRAGRPEFPNYKPGTEGPREADRLIKKDGREWVNIGRKFA